MKSLKVCFLGTPEFAATSLKYILGDSYYQVVGVVTQPDRPAGRKLQMTPSEVKVLAQQHNVPVLTPENLRKQPEILEQIKSWKADLAIVVAFGQILNDEFLNSFEFGAVNIHGSLLPLWRGAAPIQRSLENGDKETGVALQKIVKQLDAGGVIGVRKVDVQDDWNANFMYQKLAELGTDLLKRDLKDYVSGNLVPAKQDETQVTIAKKIDKSESEIDWHLTSERIHNKVRAFSMGPGTYTWLNGKKVKIHKTVVRSKTGDDLEKTGCVLAIHKDSISVQCGSGVIDLIELQPESRNRMTAGDFIKSNSLDTKTRFGK
ncbi:MAG: methionyl-tRNA formyltransferase [Bdellovibrionaceae bacterium]|nr:methionyl-tRNA formyltransferase [Pseudobdellovibrionaceae bacterium]